MKVFTLWHRGDDNDAPWIVDAVYEYTLDNHCSVPPAYAAQQMNVNVRELVIDVPEDAVRALFDSPGVKATVVKP
jgi:hypothetical protein